MFGYWYENKFYRVRSRGELAWRKHQDILAHAASTDGEFLFCGCRKDVSLRLVSYLVPGRGHAPRRWREDDPHVDPGCPFAGDLEAIFEPRSWSGSVAHTLNMFREDDGTTQGISSNGSGTSSVSERRYGDFVHFLQSHFTRASLEMFADINYGKSFRDRGILNPTLFEIFGRLVEMMSEPLLVDGSSPAAGLEQLESKLFWGVTQQPLVAESDRPLNPQERLEFQLGPHWACDGFHQHGPLLEISPEVLSQSRGKAKAMGHRISPPYLYAVVAKPSGDAYRAIHLYRIPVACVGKYIFPIESEGERRAIQILALGGVALLKLHVQGDLRILGSGLWSFKTGHDGHLLSRPDVIAFIEGKVRVIYLTDSVDAEYHRGVDQSVAEMERHLASPEVLVQKIHARSLTRDTWRQFLSAPVNRPNLN